jgi:hypothetical protein
MLGWWGGSMRDVKLELFRVWSVTNEAAVFRRVRFDRRQRNKTVLQREIADCFDMFIQEGASPYEHGASTLICLSQTLLQIAETPHFYGFDD